MERAFCTEDNEIWDVADFNELDSDVREVKRKALLCDECSGFAWYRKESRTSPAHFCAHHVNDCSLKTHYDDSSEHDLSAEENDVDKSNALIINLDDEKGGDVEVCESQQLPPLHDNEGITTGGRTVRRYYGGDSPQQSSLKRLLLRLVRSESFRASNDEVIFLKNSGEQFVKGPIQKVIKSFDLISSNDQDRPALYWGPIASIGRTNDGRLWLNSSSNYNSASVTIFADIVDDFLELFSVDDDEELLGAWVIVAGKCNYSGAGTGKPIIWCGTPNHIFVRKYRDSKLQVEN